MNDLSRGFALSCAKCGSHYVNKDLNCANCEKEQGRKDDNQIDELIVKRGEVIKGGRVDVELYELNQ